MSRQWNVLDKEGTYMSLREKRILFSKMFAQLIIAAEDLGYDAAIAFVKRCNDCPVGHKTSVHKVSLAGDLDLYKDNVYLKKTEDHEVLGLLWESWGGSWGGRWGDGNHYSIEHNGMK